MTGNRREHQRENLYSALITAFFMGSVLLFLYWYKFVIIQEKQSTPVAAMLINFGDNQNGRGPDEPAPQEGSQASPAVVSTEAPADEPSPEKTATKPLATPKEITGTSELRRAKPAEKSIINSKKSSASAATPKKSTGSVKSNPQPTAKRGNGDGQGNAAVGNLVRGRGNSGKSQGSGTGSGNAGDPLGGAGNGDSKIGIDRRLTGFIPGTMGRGGAQPDHNCSATGSITIAYTVNTAGQVISARRSSGISDPCVVSTATAWVRQYVRAERASVSSTGTYNIKF